MSDYSSSLSYPTYQIQARPPPPPGSDFCLRIATSPVPSSAHPSNPHSTSADGATSPFQLLRSVSSGSLRSCLPESNKRLASSFSLLRLCTLAAAELPDLILNASLSFLSRPGPFVTSRSLPLILSVVVPGNVRLPRRLRPSRLTSPYPLSGTLLTLLARLRTLLPSPPIPSPPP